jgi:hypothetical protein
MEEAHFLVATLERMRRVQNMLAVGAREWRRTSQRNPPARKLEPSLPSIKSQTLPSALPANPSVTCWVMFLI